MKAPKALLPLLVCTVLAWAPETLRIDSRAAAHTAGAGATAAPQVFQATSSDDFTLVLLPDTQYYSAQDNGATLAMFTAQTQWVADNKLSENIKAVVGLGDIVNCGNRTTEWQNADSAYAILDSAGVPYVPAIGNHDYDDAGCSGPIPNRIVTSYTTFFGPSRLSGYPWYGSSFPRGSNENFYITFTAGSRHYLVLALEFFPRDSALAWAQAILNANPDKEVIVTTHAYLYSDDTRATDNVGNGPASYGLTADNNGEEMWAKFIKNHANIIAVVNGHFWADGLARRVDAGDHGNLVAQMLSNYQAQPNGGGGFLRILRFRPSLGIIEVKTFSPFLNQFKTDPDNEFTIPYQGIVTPRIDSVQPAQGPIAGGTTVTVRGAHFAGASLKVNKTSVTPLSQTDTEIRFTTPPQDNGIALISIRNAAGAGYGEFLYVPPRLDEIPPGYITTIAGVGHFLGDGRPATKAMVEPTELALDSSGNMFLQGQEIVRRIRPDGIIETYAGTGVPGVGPGDGDGGPAAEARLTNPRGLAVDSAGNLYIADLAHRIRRVDAQTGIITTFAGTGVAGYSGDGGPASQAQLYFPRQIAIDRQGNIFVLEQGNARIRRIAPDGTISTFAGTGTVGFSGDGALATQAEFNFGTVDDSGLAVDPDGNLYVADTGNHRIRKIDPRTGIITTFSGLGDGNAVATDAAGNVYFAPATGNEVGPLRGRIFHLNPRGELVAAYGKGLGFSPDGTPARDADFGFIDGLAVEPQGNILFSEVSSNRLRRINIATGLLETVAGIGPALIGENGPAIGAVLINFDDDLAVLPSGELLVANRAEYRLRKIDVQGNINTVAGSGLCCFGRSFEGAALGVEVQPFGVDVDKSGNIYVSITSQVLRIDTDGIVRRVAGALVPAPLGDGGPATEAGFVQAWDVAVDEPGNIFVADTNNNRIRRVDARTGIITTVAGSGPSNGTEAYGRGSFCGDGRPAVEACLNTPFTVAVDKSGTLFIADTENTRIRQVDRNGIITTYIPARVTKMTSDGAGNLYFAGAVVTKVSPDGVATTIAGRYEPGFSGDGGPALEAQFRPLTAGIAIDKEGNLFLGDGHNRRIRAMRFGAIVAPRDAVIEARGGTPQQTTAGNLFPLVLVASVRDAASNPAVGTQVTFTAPSGGPSCTFPNGQTTFTTLTDRFGHASVTCRASSLAGSFSVTAAALGLAQTATFQLANFAPDSSPTPIPAGSAVTTFIPHIITGQGFVTRLTLVNLTGNTNNIRIHFLTQNGAVESTFSRTLTAAGASAEVSTGESERFTQPQTRWAAIGSDFPVGVTVFFELKHAPDALPVTGVGFSAPRLLRQLVLPVRFEPATPQPFTVGIALANPTGQSNPITVTLRDALGNAVAQDSSLTLPAFGQTAFLFTDLPGLKPFLAGQPSFKGSVAIAAGQPLSAIGVGDDFGPFFAIEPFEGTTCLPFFCTGTSSAIPHIVSGAGLRTVITLVNLSSGSNSVTLQRFNQDGTQGQAVNVSLPPSGRFEIDTGEQARFAPVTTQWATLQTQGPVGVNVFFDLKHPAARGEVVTAVGFSNLQPVGSFFLPAAFARPAAVLGQTEPLTVGLALANPANDFSRVTLRLLDENGAQVAEDSSTQLAPKGQAAFVVSELPEIKRFLQNRPPFRGLLSISATQPLAPLAVGDDFGPFFALPVLSALSH